MIAQKRDNELVRAALAQVRAADDAARALTVVGPGTGSSILDARAPSPAQSIPGYTIVCEMHRGGQGVVFEGRQNSTGQRVAIKVLREGPLASHDERLRFEREVQILGRVEHPNIVRIIDSGDFGGSYYLVTDYIEGKPLDLAIQERYASSSDSGSRGTGSHVRTYALRSRLHDIVDMFVPICDAVHSAHLHGVIHRDLKPSNIRVDQHGRPMVLDFGLAKLITTDNSDQSFQTETGQFLGSLPWASPEQARGSGQVDLRTDVYSIGVLLYQMVTGTFPYTVLGALSDVLHRIQHDEPIPPSRRNRAVRDELETVILKCLQKDAVRRYQSAGDLARDLRNLLDGAPIEAKRDSFGYVLRNQLRRYRWPVAIIILFAVCLTSGLVASILLWQDAARQRDRALLAESQAQQRLVEAEKITELTQSILTTANPFEQRGQSFTVRQALDLFNRRLGDSLADQPRAELAMRETIGETYRLLGESTEAESQLRRALLLTQQQHPDDAERLATAQLRLGWALRDEGRFAESLEQYEAALRLLEASGSRPSKALASTWNALAGHYLRMSRMEEAEAAIERGLAAADHISDRREETRAALFHHLASLRLDQDRLEDAERIYRETIDLYRLHRGPRDPDVAANLHDLGMVVLRLGRVSEAAAILQESIEILREAFGDDSPMMAQALQGLALVRRQEQKLAEAESLLRQAISVHARARSPRHFKAAGFWNDLGVLLQNLTRYDESAEALRTAISIMNEAYPEGVASTAVTMNNLAQTLYMSGDAEAAEPLIRDAVAMDRRLLPPDHSDLIDSLRGHSLILEKLGRIDAAIDVSREVLDSYERTGLMPTRGRAQRLRLSSLLATHADNLAAAGRAQEAAAAAEECLSIRKELLAEGDWQIDSAKSVLGGVRALEGRRDEAEPLLRDAARGLAEKPDVPPLARQRAAERLEAFERGN